jgi:flagellar protein FlaJ
MNFAIAFSRFSHRLFGPIADGMFSREGDFAKTLKKANLKITVGEFFSSAFLIVIVLTPLMTIAVSMIMQILNKSPIIPLIMTLILFPVFVLLFFYVYPSYVADNRKRNIDAKLPYAVPYMSAMAGAGVPPDLIFNSLARSPLYGEITEEAKNITRDVNLFGYDIITAISRYSVNSPSRKWGELLQGMVTTIRSGGDMKLFLHNEANTIMVEFKRIMKEFTETLGLFAEAYITVPVFGMIFIIIILTVLGMIQSGGVNKIGPFTMFEVIYLCIYIGIPGLSCIFLLMIDSIIPPE